MRDWSHKASLYISDKPSVRANVYLPNQTIDYDSITKLTDNLQGLFPPANTGSTEEMSKSEFIGFPKVTHNENRWLDAKIHTSEWAGIMWNFVLRLLIRIIRLREFRANMFRCFVQRIFRQVQSRPGSSVGIATGYGLDGPRIESRWGGETFRTCPDRPWVPPNLLYHVTGPFPGVKSGRVVTLTPHPF
jgi:hypothetical protein